MRNTSLTLLALNNIGPKADAPRVTVDDTTLCLYDRKRGEIFVSTDRRIETNLPGDYKIIVGAMSNMGVIILGVDARLELDADVAQKIGDGLVKYYGEKINLDTVAIDTMFDTKLVLLERDGNTWKFKEMDIFRSFEVTGDNKFALVDQKGGLSWGISFQKMLDLLDGKSAFEPKVTFAAGSRLVPGVPGTKFGVYDPKMKKMHYLDLENKFITGQANVIPVKSKGGAGYATVARDADGAVSMVGKIGDISEAFEVGGEFYKGLTAAADKIGNAHKAPESMANAK